MRCSFRQTPIGTRYGMCYASRQSFDQCEPIAETTVVQLVNADSLESAVLSVGNLLVRTKNSQSAMQETVL